MASLTMSASDEFKSEIAHFSWINWSNIAQEEFCKKEMFERFIASGSITDEDEKFCDSIDWHPVDELPLKESFIKEINARKKEQSVKYASVDKLFEEL